MLKFLLRSESRVVPACVFIIIDAPESSCEWFISLKIKRLSKDLRLFRIDTISQLDGRESFRGGKTSKTLDFTNVLQGPNCWT